MTGSVIIAAPLLIAAIVAAVRFVGCGLDTSGLEVSASYSGTVSGTSGLESFWQLADTSTSPPTAHDSADSNDGTYQGGFTLGVNGLLNSSASDSGNKAAQFDGHSGDVTVAINKPNLKTASFTVEALVQPSGIDANTHVVVSCDSAYQLALVGNTFQASVADGGALQSPVVVNANAQAGTPYYVAMTYDAPSTTLQLFVNPAASDGFGTFLQTENTGDQSYASATVNYQAATSGNFLIGASASGPSEFFPGVIQDVAVYNRVLTFCEIVQHYWIFATGYLVPCSGSGAALVGNLTGKGTLSAQNVGFAPHAPTTQTISTVGLNTYDIPYWCTYIDLILVGGGGGGSYSSFSSAVGGAGGQLVGQTFQRGGAIPWMTTTITVTVGSGGKAGTGSGGPTAGGPTTATWTGKPGSTPLTAGGGGAMASTMGQTGTGTSPASVTVNGTPYSGGTSQATPAGTGNKPGGGGAGGSGIDLDVAGGAGAAGVAYVVARQS